MQFEKLWLSLVATFMASAVGSTVCDGAFESTPNAGSCAARITTIAARSQLECAVRASQPDDTSRSFSFTNGACVFSDSPDCTTGGAGVSVLRKKIVYPHPGYEQMIDGRRFWVFQERKSGVVDFSRVWSEYEVGFGDGTNGNDTEFWSGLQRISAFTTSHTSNMRIELATFGAGVFYFAEWSSCTVGDATTDYVLNCGAKLDASSNISGDPMTEHRGMKFSTKDRDNDLIADTSCSAITGYGGFWLKSCTNLNPNGQYPTQVLSGGPAYPYISSGSIDNFATLRSFRMMLLF